MTTEAAEIIAKWGQPTHRVAASPDRIARFREMVPDLLLLLWAEFGFSGFADGLWWLCDPVAWQDAVDVWIPRANLEIGEDDWIAVSRGAFGRLSLWGRRTGMSLEIVPHLGAVYQHDESANMATPRQRDEQLREALMTPSRYTFDVTGQDGDGLFDRALRAHGQVGPDTVYGFFPALAIGGPARVDRIEVVDAAVHLDLLAQMTPRQVFPDTTELLRWHCVEGDQTGLAGRRARLLTKEPTDDAGYPADLPPGTRQVVIVDDTPNPTLTLRVQTLGDHPVAAYVRFDQLAVRDEDPVETGVEDAVQVAFQLLRKAGIQTTVDGQPSSYPHRARSDEIAQILASACPPGWQSLQAAFSMAGGQEIIQVVALTPGGPVNVAVPLRAAELAREHRVMTAGAAGPWLRMLMELNSAGRLQMSFDYGDVPLPADQLLAPEAYLRDVAQYPREQIALWLLAHMGNEGRQLRTAAQAQQPAGGAVRVVDALPAFGLLWSRMAVIAAMCRGVNEPYGVRLDQAFAVFRGDQGWCTVARLPGGRGVISGGRPDSPLLTAAYQGKIGWPDLYQGAPPWVHNLYLDPYAARGLLSFCSWWDGQVWRGADFGGDGIEEMFGAVPAVWSTDATARTVTGLLGAIGVPLNDRSHYSATDFVRAAEADAVTEPLLRRMFGDGVPSNFDLAAAMAVLDAADVLQR